MPSEEDRFEILEHIDAAQLMESWKNDFGIDVARLFEGVDQITLQQAFATGRLSFQPVIEGDAAFYKSLRQYKWYHPATKEEYRRAAEGLQEHDHVTDVGAGIGAFASYIRPGHYCGLETDHEAAKAAQAKGVNVIHSDMAGFMSSKRFRSAHLVTAFQVLEHMADPDTFISQLGALAHPGGRVAIGVPDANAYVSDLPDFMLNAPPHHLTWWTEATLREAIEAAGLRVVSAHRFAVEPWERQLWWMGRLAKIARSQRSCHFGRSVRVRKIASFLGSWILQKCPIPNTAQGSTLLMMAEKPV